jgi:hypothetical protein
MFAQDATEAGKRHVRRSEQRTLLGGAGKQALAHGCRGRRIRLEDDAEIGARRMQRRIKQRVADDQQALAAIGDAIASVAGRVAGEIDRGDGARQRTLAVEALQARLSRSCSSGAQAQQQRALRR